MTILAAGDHFVRTDLLTGALRAELGGGPDGGPAIRELTLPWPVEPFGRVAEVDEASGTEDLMIEAVGGIEVAVTQMAPFTRKVLENAPGLRLVVVSRGGPVNVNVEAATERGIRVCYAPGRNATATAEFTVGMLLATLRRIPETHAALALRGEWASDYYTYEKCGLEIEGTTVGLVGCGAIGGRVARILAAFGAEVLIFDPYAPADVPGERVGSLDELMSRARIVSLHARVTPETRGLIGAREIGLMPRGSVLVNVARGPLLDYDALCDALESGQLMGAGLDTFAVEPPPPGARIFDVPNLVMTPHLGGASRAVAEKAARIVAAEVGRYRRGEPLAHCLNP
ncbi:2-hydroxyacid dehydrogenase [Actinomadura viridis]|uniref:D-3-phosphoglycerate dehydrogenase n=1 Tax=Actinomadura viridis TaxID=58110 RepID=A0A931DP06_9ACTN|nr:2-hydroxyacid dehydrogenase [Actinomadura viridis]MBG6090660.1 D-3-phosphoglycerate dehydrogenase [Actinomadura viridis]